MAMLRNGARTARQPNRILFATITPICYTAGVYPSLSDRTCLSRRQRLPALRTPLLREARAAHLRSAMAWSFDPRMIASC